MKKVILEDSGINKLNLGVMPRLSFKELGNISNLTTISNAIKKLEDILSKRVGMVDDQKLRKKITRILVDSPMREYLYESILLAIKKDSITADLQSKGFFNPLLADYNKKLLNYQVSLENLCEDLKVLSEGFFKDFLINIIDGINDLVICVRVCKAKQAILTNILSQYDL